MTGDLIFYKYTNNGNGGPYKTASYTALDSETYFGIHMGKDFVSSLKVLPPMKDDITNVSRTEHGTRFKHITDQSGNAYKGERSVTLTLNVHETGVRGTSSYKSIDTNIAYFMEQVLCKGHFAVRVPARGNEVFFLKYVSCQSYAETRSGRSCKLAIKCVEYNPSKRAFENS